MPWILASLISAFFLGCYDLNKKHAISGNAVFPVLFLSALVGASIWTSLLALQSLAPESCPPWLLVEQLTWQQHLLLLAKAGIVSCSWVFSYFGEKHLPISIASPIRATGPLWTIFGAVMILAERPSGLECLGIATTLISFIGLSMAGQKEGIHFHKNPWVWRLIVGTILGACSGLYDKYLLGGLHLKASTVQAWFSIYLVPVLFPFALGWKLRWWPRKEFQWRWSIPFIAICLLIADFVYFGALRNPEALVSIVSSLRRGSTLVAFAGGILLFGEHNGARKLPAVLGILAGIILTILG